MMTAKREGIGMTSRRTRERLLERLVDDGIKDERVLEAIIHTPRHLFIDEALASRAYDHTALPIGHRQTISQPYTVALMTEVLLAGKNLKRVLEVGTGSGYQTAILARLCNNVCTVERINALLIQARQRLFDLRYKNVFFKNGDGNFGWEEHSPFDGIIVTAAAPGVPKPLCEQLAVHGRLIIPVGNQEKQELVVVTRDKQGLTQEQLEWVNFVPLLTGTT